MNRFILFFRTRRRIGWPDIVVAIMIIGLLYALLDLGKGMVVPFSPSRQPVIHLNPVYLPYYAGRSLLRLFIAYVLSLAFALVYGRFAAYHKLAERVMIPALDILQSVPVLGFLSITVTFFLGLFPGSLLGAEFASIFVIFTAQAWNITFSFYHSLTTMPKDLREAAAVYRLRPWARFTRLEVPYGMIPLVWNSMMSFGGSWFFLTASETITVLHYNIHLPGIGSYIAEALRRGDGTALFYGIAMMVAVIVAVDQFLWRPLVAWSQKFKMNLNDDSDVQTSWFLHLIRRSEWVHALFRSMAAPLRALLLDRSVPRKEARQTPESAQRRARVGSIVSRVVLTALLLLAVRYAFDAARVVARLGLPQVLYVLKLGLYTFLRVIASTVLGAAWTVPVGVAIGLHPRLSRIAQPLVQIAASFPSNVLYPLIAIAYVAGRVSLNIGAIPLMMLGTQWYILFNVIAGAMAIPNDLKEASSVLRLRRSTWWKTFILPAIYPSLITGGITATGGAWNASILAELVSWRHYTLTADGLGAYITAATTDGNWARITWGIAVMCLFVVVANRFIWRPLYRLAETKYRLGD